MTDSVADAAVRYDLAPHGRLRVAINFGNTALVQRNGISGELGGISIDLARALAIETDLALEFVGFGSAGQVVEALAAGKWDVAFLAIDTTRSSQLAFTPPYLQIEGRYMVRDASSVHDAAALDAPNVRIAVTAGSAYDLFLTRLLQRARLERFSTSNESFEAFMEQNMDAAAGVANVLRGFLSRRAGLRILDPAFMTIEQAIATPIGRVAGAKYLADFMSRHIAEASHKIGIGQSALGQSALNPS